MDTIAKNNEKARFDTRLPKEQKALFEYAAELGGYRTLTEFVLHVVQEKAESIIQQHQQILASERDRAIFFEAMMEVKTPNEALQAAAEKYQKMFSRQ